MSRVALTRRGGESNPGSSVSSPPTAAGPDLGCRSYSQLLPRALIVSFCPSGQGGVLEVSLRYTAGRGTGFLAGNGFLLHGGL